MVKVSKIKIDKTPNGRYRAIDLNSDSGYGLQNRAWGNSPARAIKNLKKKILPKKEKCEDWNGKKHNTFKSDGAILHAYEIGFNNCINKIEKNIDKLYAQAKRF